MKEPTLVIMAAGLGSRFGGLKQITPISNNEIILDYSLFDAVRAGFKRAVLVIKEENKEAFDEILKDAKKHIEIIYAFQDINDVPAGYEIPKDRVRPLGTAHAMYAARKYIDSSFVVINSDDYYGPTAFNEIYDFLLHNDSYAMVGYQIENTLTLNGTVSRGVCLEKDSYLVGIEEKLKLGLEDGKIIDQKTREEFKPGTPVSLNFFGFTKDFMDYAISSLPIFMEEAFGNKEIKEFAINGDDKYKAEFALPNLVFQSMKKNNKKVKILKTPDKWYGVTYMEDLEEVQNAIKRFKEKGIYPIYLWD